MEESDLQKRTKWLFKHTGHLHGAWKHRRYTEIRNMAARLPKDAWDAGFIAGLESAASFCNLRSGDQWGSNIFENLIKPTREFFAFQGLDDAAIENPEYFKDSHDTEN